jgi:hypothetical protein
MIDCIVEIEWNLSESNASSLREEISRLLVLENAAEIASKTSFAIEPLAGVGSSPWQVLYNAAREYSTQVAYPDRDFPVLDNEALCVLCMQPLQEDTKARMARFKAFMEGATKRQLDTATEGIQKKRRSLEQTTFPPTEIVKSVVDEIRNRNEQLAKQTEAYLTAMQERRNHMIQSIADKQPEAYPPAEPIAVECLVKVSDQFEKEAQDIEETAKPEELAAKKNERDGLLAWKLVSQKKQEIVTYVTQLKTSVKYNECIAETAFKHITDRGRDIISAALTDRLIEALGRELKNLNASYLPLNLRPSGVEGETRYRMELTGSCLSKADLSEILSEGEQHVVAIAGFLAELGIRDHKCPIVLDDPVCSLDHQYRDKVAERLAKEAITRQVIVFTHDIAFLLELQHSAAEQGAYFHIQTVARHGNTPGDCSEGAPWHAMSVLDRIKHLKKELNNFEGLYGIDWGQYNQKASYLYGLLRETWEAAVEEELLFKTIRRHGNEVQTKRLAQVEVTTSDYVEIESQIGRCSTWMVGHDKSKALSVNRPSPDEIRRDIQSLETFRSNIRNRAKRLNEEREQALQTRRPSVG